jgi:steroid delta-isomerase-like uncharacterized protein
MKIDTHPIRAGKSRIGVRGPRKILESMLNLLSEGKIAEVVGAFDEDFTYADHALGLEFKEKGRLTKFLQKSRELFPDTIIGVVSVFESGERGVAEWRLTANPRVPSRTMNPQLPISLHGVSIVQVKGERITSWSAYYDPLESSRRGLAAQFIDWVGAFGAFEEAG